ncbi:hypothetical protein HPP92_008040 [Vanilla planifolia]|uniref:Glycosyltransferase n=1 Tax=Vanilla planifolia TaxID=51239 RepID=A0A835RSK9_VANPL|nr:hypothetical protein HPP92_008040 [Vanilla planifolia]
MAKSSSIAELKVFLVPFLAPGHMIPMVHLAHLLSHRGVISTIVTTPGNADLIRPSLSTSSVHLLTIPFPSDLPDNLTAFRSPEIPPDFYSALCRLEPHLEHLLLSHRPDCLISDIFLPWTAYLAEKHRIPRLAFHGTSSFSTVVMTAIVNLRLLDSVSRDDESFLIPGFPHHIEMYRSQLPYFITSPPAFVTEVAEAYKQTFGTVVNSFHELEPAYAAMLGSQGARNWLVGPLSFFRLSGAVAIPAKIFSFLESKEHGSVVYVCFGSLSRFTVVQMREIKTGLEAANRPYLWVVTDEATTDYVAGEANGLVVSGWVPQVEILNHPAIGGFVTHCGWNSSLEGIIAGVPMVTWPLFAEQFINERLLVDVLRVAVGVGTKVSRVKAEDRLLVPAEKLTAAVEAVMGGSEDADERRQRANELKETAAAVVADGGSSVMELDLMLEELSALKMARIHNSNYE